MTPKKNGLDLEINNDRLELPVNEMTDVGSTSLDGQKAAEGTSEISYHCVLCNRSWKDEVPFLAARLMRDQCEVRR